jgi:methylated-DNA-[protein]-cysteine S-methyltransferase
MHDAINIVRTPLGWCALLGCGQQLKALAFGYKNADAAVVGLNKRLPSEARVSAWNRPLAQRIVAALEGEPDDFADVEVNLDHLTPLGQRIASACRCIPWGQTRSYGELAEIARRPGAARAVGRVMSQNRTPLVVPCHRVIASGGKLGGYSAPQGLSAKRRLLAIESAVIYNE